VIRVKLGLMGKLKVGVDVGENDAEPRQFLRFLGHDRKNSEKSGTISERRSAVYLTYFGTSIFAGSNSLSFPAKNISYADRSSSP